MESDEDDVETQASFCRFLDDNFILPISAYAPGYVPKVEIKKRLYIYETIMKILYHNHHFLKESAIKTIIFLHFRENNLKIWYILHDKELE